MSGQAEVIGTCDSVDATAATMLPPSSGEELFATSARGVGLKIANALIAIPMLQERIEVLEAALAAATRDNDSLRAQLANVST
jgi:hypothetical protein